MRDDSGLSIETCIGTAVRAIEEALGKAGVALVVHALNLVTRSACMYTGVSMLRQHSPNLKVSLRDPSVSIATVDIMTNAIETAGLTKSFGSHVCVDLLDLCIPSAKVTGFVGPNGAGRTTTIRMLLGLMQVPRISRS